MNRISWKEIILGTIAGLSLLTSPAVGQMSRPADEPPVRMDNRGPGSLNSGPGSLNSGPGSMNSGRDGRDHMNVAQANDVRQEDRRVERREDRRENRQLDRREDRREDRQDASVLFRAWE